MNPQLIEWLIEKLKKDFIYIMFIALIGVLYWNEKERRQNANLTIASVRADRDAWRYLYVKCIKEDTAKFNLLTEK